LLVFGERFERFERVTPEAVKIGAYALDAIGVQLVDASVTNRVIENQVSVFEHA
jgi:hypothetical protein